MRNSNYKTVLGLDLGVASIGWSLVQLPLKDGLEPSILGMGVRVIPLSADEKTEFTAGKAQQKNAKRRQMRGMRRNLQRYGLRRQRLRYLLEAHGMMPPKELFAMERLALWDLRARAVSERIALQELGRVLFHINQKRGFKSNRKTDQVDDAGEDGKPSKGKKDELSYTERIQARKAALEATGLSIGAYFAQQLAQNPHAKMREEVYPRAIYIDEFDRIWATQAAFHPEALTEALYREVRDRTIFHQRPLKSAKGLVSGCKFESRTYRDKSGKWVQKPIPAAPISSPLYQEFRIWQELNNVRILAKDGTETALTLAQMQQLHAYLSENAFITTTNFLKAVLGKGRGKEKWNKESERMPGNKTLAEIRKALGEEALKHTAYLQFDAATTQLRPVDLDRFPDIEIEGVRIGQREELPPSVEMADAYLLWNLLYSAEDNDELRKNLEERGFSSACANSLLKVKLEDGYGTLSSKALRRILPYLRLGLTYDKACLAAGYNHSDADGTLDFVEELAEQLEPIHSGELRNPAVERILNQCINVVNAILAQYGHPDDIHVELARELKQDAKKREKATSENNRRDKENKAIKELLEGKDGEKGVLKRATREDIEKYRLWKEMDMISPYEPKNPISLQELFGGLVDVEHIIPRSRLFDDSFQNKTIARRKVNKAKDNTTGWDFMKSQGAQALHDYEEFIALRLEAKDGINKGKAAYLRMSMEEIPNDFLARQIKETQYISKQVLTRLRPLVHEKSQLMASSGGVTAFLRHQWGLDDMLQKLVWDKYAAKDKTRSRNDKDGKRITFIEGWSKRDDHRHHALDALVVAMTSRSLIQRLNTLNADADQRDTKWRPQAPWPGGFLHQIERAMQGIIISLKPGKRDAVKSLNRYKRKGAIAEQVTWTPRGELHNQSVYGINYSQAPAMVKLDAKIDPMGIVQPHIKRLVLDHVARHGGHAPTALADLKRNPIWLDEVAKIPLKEVEYRQPRTVKRSPLLGLKAKDIADVVDARVRAILQARIASHGEAKAFDNLAQDPVWFNEAAGIKIERVRLYERPAVDSVRKIRRGYVAPSNNHHAALYRDAEGKLQEHLCTFWDAVARRKAGVEVIVRHPQATFDQVLAAPALAENVLPYLPDPSWTFVQSYAQNELFLICPDEGQAEALLAAKDLSAMSPWVFRVQKISSKYYVFRHHLETRVDGNNDETNLSLQTQRTVRIQSLNLPFHKLRFNLLGHLIASQP